MNNAIWITYESPESLKTKVEYVNNRSLGGMMIWELAGDSKALTFERFAFNLNENSLLRTVSSFLYGIYQPNDYFLETNLQNWKNNVDLSR